MGWIDKIAGKFGYAKQRDVTGDPQAMRAIKARYDAAQSTNEFVNYWANVDWFDADSANSKEVRQKLTRRSRYEVANNGYADGIAQTYATDLIDVGPSLRMLTPSPGFNAMVERTWRDWTAAIQFRRKLWTMAHAKHTDGEAIAVIRLNDRVKHPVKLDIHLYETEQCQTPYQDFFDPLRIDGIKFDESGEPVWYDILKQHPGSARQLLITLVPEQVPADRVLHWFKMRRPGQHRGVPETASTLNLGAAFRRFREANLSTAEKVAEFTLLLKTMFQPDEIDEVDPMTSFPLTRGMLMSLPNSMEPYQLKAEHPSASYAEFHKTLVNEQARPKSMPFNKAACDSSSYNYASGRLDHQTYYGSLDVDREDCNDTALEKLFPPWFDLSAETFGWLGGNSLAIGPGARAHQWDWPKHAVADVEAEANAAKTKLNTAQIGLDQLFTDGGFDLEEQLPIWAQTFGVTDAELRARLLDVVLPIPKTAVATGGDPLVNPAVTGPPTKVAATSREALLASLNGNGHKFTGTIDD